MCGASIYGASATVWNVGERCYADAQGVGRLLWGVEALSLSLSLSLWPFSSFLVSPPSFFNFLISSLLLLDCLFSLPPLFFLVFLFFQYLLADRLYALSATSALAV